MFVAGYQLTQSPPALSMLFKVIGTDTDWSGSCDILLVIHSHHRPNLYRFRGKGRLRSKQAVRKAATICPAPCKLTFDLLTLKMMSESRVTWPTSVPILVFLGLSVFDLGPMYATDWQTSDAQHRLMPRPKGRSIKTQLIFLLQVGLLKTPLTEGYFAALTRFKKYSDGLYKM